MIALSAAFLLASTPSFETITKRASFAGTDTPLGMIDEMKIAINSEAGVVGRFTYRTSYQKEGSVFETWRDEELLGLRTLTLRGQPEDWSGLSLPEGSEVQGLSLEDIFIACVGSRLVQI